MFQMQVGEYTIQWFVNPKKVGQINWKEIDYPPEETVHFEKNGSGKYVYAKRNHDGKMTKVAKAVKNYVFLPFVFGVINMLTGLNVFMSQNSGTVALLCYSGICMLLVLHYMVRQHEVYEEKRAN